MYKIIKCRFTKNQVSVYCYEPTHRTQILITKLYSINLLKIRFPVRVNLYNKLYIMYNNIEYFINAEQFGFYILQQLPFKTKIILL